MEQFVELVQVVAPDVRKLKAPGFGLLRWTSATQSLFGIDR